MWLSDPQAMVPTAPTAMLPMVMKVLLIATKKKKQLVKTVVD